MYGANPPQWAKELINVVVQSRNLGPEANKYPDNSNKNTYNSNRYSENKSEGERSAFELEQVISDLKQEIQRLKFSSNENRIQRNNFNQNRNFNNYDRSRSRQRYEYNRGRFSSRKRQPQAHDSITGKPLLALPWYEPKSDIQGKQVSNDVRKVKFSRKSNGNLAKCFKCDKFGHIARFCRSSSKN